ncbi:39S ribosomal protein L35, mitochondrial [Hyla sarda]|uniref:39S ribosomal protein L35, mitochondrial n=1 Tax=Hyla sarda TaxID=327740 RepID=UPI0024C418D1|nr:39S ribosomal protein L35, mitochondrial [Hyla sarda]
MALCCGPLRAACARTGSLLRQWPQSAAATAALLRPLVNPCMSGNIRHLWALSSPLTRSAQRVLPQAGHPLAPTHSGTILSSVTSLLPSILQHPSRKITYVSVRKGKRKSVRSVTKRFMRLHCGLWIRRKAGYKKKLWKKKAARKKRLREIVFCNKTQSKLLDKMTSPFWKRRNWYVNDPYQKYHDRTNLKV